MLADHAELIALLSSDVVTVRPVRRWPIALAQGLVAIGMVVFVVTVLGVRPDVAAADPASQLVVREAILGVAAILLHASAIRGGYPGTSMAVPLGLALGVLAALPGLAALSLLLWDRDPLSAQHAIAEFGDFWRCLRFATLLALPSAMLHAWWLRKYGAVTSPVRAAFSTGLAAGATALLAFGVSCPSVHWLYAGVTYHVVIALSAVIARLVLVRWLRW